MTLYIPNGYALISHHMKARTADRTMTFTIGVDMTSISNKQAALDTYELEVQSNGEIFAAASFSSDYEYLGISATIGTEVGPLPWSRVRNRVGTGAQVPVPPNSAILVQKRTALGGRQNRGRMFLPPAWIGEGNVDHLGNIDANLSTIQGYVANMFGFLVDGELIPVVLHTANPPGEDPPATPAPITQMSVQSKLATQRKRMR